MRACQDLETRWERRRVLGSRPRRIVSRSSVVFRTVCEGGVGGGRVGSWVDISWHVVA